ncbi:hypothetical protein BGX28_001032, partial [Mortierella sp. GBA30]
MPAPVFYLYKEIVTVQSLAGFRNEKKQFIDLRVEHTYRLGQKQTIKVSFNVHQDHDQQTVDFLKHIKNIKIGDRLEISGDVQCLAYVIDRELRDKTIRSGNSLGFELPDLPINWEDKKKK